MNYVLVDNSAECKEALNDTIVRALEKCGLVAEAYAKQLCETDTGLLKNSITHAISGKAAAIESYAADRPKPGRQSSGFYNGTAPQEGKNELAVYIGSNVEYAAYVELGTGAENYPGGRPTPWAYKDGNGNWHTTRGNPAKPYLVPAVADYKDKYEQIFQQEGLTE